MSNTDAMLQNEIVAMTMERDEAVKQQQLGWERAAENYRAYEQAMAERDAERTARKALVEALNRMSVDCAEDDAIRSAALALAAKLP